MILSEETKQDLARKFGREIMNSSDFDNLSLAIEEKTGERLSVNTLKRLFGYIQAVALPRATTMDILANYLGYKTWKRYTYSKENTGSSAFRIWEGDKKDVDVSSLKPGQEVSFCYEPDRAVTLKYLGDFVFEVESSVNSKLQEGDLLTVSFFCYGYPLHVSKVIRGGECLGSFEAGRKGGIFYLRKHKK